jgi:hypothetical protein
MSAAGRKDLSSLDETLSFGLGRLELAPAVVIDWQGASGYVRS